MSTENISFQQIKRWQDTQTSLTFRMLDRQQKKQIDYMLHKQIEIFYAFINRLDIDGAHCTG